MAYQPGDLEKITTRTNTREKRMTLAATDPILFALIYLQHHMRQEPEDPQTISFADHHKDWAGQAKRWVGTRNTRDRNAFIAPRDSGKSTWWFLVLPLWAAAFGYSKFTAAFADSAGQAEGHLATFKKELDNNALLRADFPDLCTPAKRGKGQAVADNRGMFAAQSGFTFAARGIDSASLGLKANEYRPDLLIFDDIEPDESSYSAYQAAKRLMTVQDAILPMNIKAKVVFVGTVTMPGGIMHQFVQYAQGKDDLSRLGPNGERAWIEDEGITPHYYPPMTTADDGTQVSCWPERWSVEYLQSIQRTRSYAKNFKNMPIATDGEYWSPEDFVYEALDLDGEHAITQTVISVDPAVSTNRRSDYTGVSLLAYAPPMAIPNAVAIRKGRNIRVPMYPPKVFVCDAWELKLPPALLRQRVLDIIEESLTPVTLVYVEVNQGGNTWEAVFHDMPVPVKVKVQSVKKEVRAAQLLAHYQRGRVVHVKEHQALEEQMLGYPKVLHDDLIDSVGTGVSYLATRKRANNGPQVTANIAWA